tara:strand:- start:77 stop:1249 length:1173 start_codon:yes stop_codon:yes gene_type:complete
MAITPTGSMLTIQALAYSLGYSSSEAASVSAGNVDLGSIIKRFCGTTHATSSQKYSAAGNEVGGLGLGDWGVDKFENPTIDASGGVTGTTGASYHDEGDTGLVWARVQNCGKFWSGSAENKETVGGNGTYWTWTQTTSGYTADVSDIILNTTGPFTASWSTPDDGADDGNQTWLATFNCADKFNVSASNYGTNVSSTFTIIESGEESAGGGGPGGGGCLKIGTEILMSDGSWKRIEQIQINDTIKSINFENLPDGDRFGDYEPFYVDNPNKMISTTSTILSTQIDYYYDHRKITDSNGGVIEVTGTHPLLVYTNTGWGSEYLGRHVIRFKRVRDITTDDKLVTTSGDYLDISSIETINSEEQMCIFNAEDVDTGIGRIGNHTFILHNGKG